MVCKMRELLFTTSRKDFEISTFRCGTKGGQHANKTSSGFRVKHLPSGAVGESRTHKSQHANKKEARIINGKEEKRN